ncbi:hypothetical protein J6590_078948 [Homalodisca vitripennis]|nr:hypothetical protein J6590_078948 [Homalodisca vitripennis]
MLFTRLFRFGVGGYPIPKDSIYDTQHLHPIGTGCLKPWDWGLTVMQICGTIPDRRRLQQKWEMYHYLTQFVTGQGNFKANLKGFNLVEEERCECGELETANHVLMECELFEEERRDLGQMMTSKHLQWRRANFDFDEETIKEFRTITRRIGIKREGTRV